MTSYEFYVCKYGGKAIQPDEWRTAYADADALIQRYERLYRVGYPTDSARDTAVCAIADAQRRFADVQSGAVAAPASVTIGSVSMCLAKCARVLNQNGLEYTADNIDALMLQRHENKKLLRAGKHPKGAAKRTKEQDIRFCDALERILNGTSGNQQTEYENVSFARR